MTASLSISGSTPVGQILASKYRVDAVLGVGGMGMVVAATHLGLEQKVALKFMLPHALASKPATERFLREAKAAARLRSEHICRVLDLGELDNGAPYIVMEFMEGEDFAQLIKRRGALTPSEAADYILQALEGLAEAHANGIVHRDIKPANLFVTRDNAGAPLVKILDFGISKSSLTAGGIATNTREVMGSPAYMAPEQMASAKNVDARADVWALGVILYQAVTGTRPFDAETLHKLFVDVSNRTPIEPARLRNNVPAEYSAAIMRCLGKKPDDRFRTVGELATALAPFGTEGAVALAKRANKVLRRTQVTTSDVDALSPEIALANRRGTGELPPTMMSDEPPAPTMAPQRASLAGLPSMQPLPLGPPTPVPPPPDDGAQVIARPSFASMTAERTSIVPPRAFGRRGPWTRREKIAVFGGAAVALVAVMAIGAAVAMSGGRGTAAAATPVPPTPAVVAPPAAANPAATPVTPADPTAANPGPPTGDSATLSTLPTRRAHHVIQR